MKTDRKQKSYFRRGLWWKVPVGLTLALLIALAAVIVYIDPIAHSLVNRTLKRYLQAGGVLDQVHIRLGEGIVEMNGLTVNAPRGFGNDPLLSLAKLRFDIDPAALLDGKFVVEELVVGKLSLVLVRDKKGRLSFLSLLPQSGSESQKTKAQNEPANQGKTAIPPLRFDRIRIEKITVHLIDHLAGEKWRARGALDLTADDLRIKDLLNRDVSLGRLNLTVHDVNVDQPKGFGPAPLLRLDRFGVAASKVNLRSSTLPVDRLRIENLTASLQRNAAGVTNLQQLADAWGVQAPENDDPSRDKMPAAASPGSAATSRAVFPTLSIQEAELKSLAFQFLNEVNGGKPWRAGFDRLDVKISGLTAGDPARKEASLGSFAMDLAGLTVDQPPGDDAGPLADLAQFSVRTGRLDLASPQLVVQSITAKEPSARIIVDADGTSNLDRLRTALMGETKPEKDPSAPSKTDQGADEPANKPPAVLFEQVQISNGSFTYQNNAVSAEGLKLALNHAALSAARLHLFGENQETPPASVSASFQIVQPGELPAALFGAEATVGPIGTVPPVNAQTRLVGFKLDTLGSLVPPATRTALGATGFDASAAMVMDRHSIHLYAAVDTDRGVEYEALGVHGPLDKPTIVLADVLSGAFDRISDGLVNLGGDALGAGLSIAKGGVSVVGEVGKGGWNLGKNLVSSAFEIAKGAVTLDRGDIGKGLKGATAESLSITAGSVKGAGSAAGHGLIDSVSNLKGDDRVRAWDRQIPARYEAVMNQAREALAKMPYPPAVQ